MSQMNYFPPPYQNMDMPYPYPQQGVPPYPINKEIRDAPSEDASSNDDASNNYFTKYLNSHIGKHIIVYCSFTDSASWHDRIFEGTLVTSGDDYIIVDETKIKKQVMILSVYVHYIEFNT